MRADRITTGGWIFYSHKSESQELQAISSNVTAAARYALGANIDASATLGWNSGAGFVPIANFQGVLDGSNLAGGNYTISNLYINRPSTNSVGLLSHTPPLAAGTTRWGSPRGEWNSLLGSQVQTSLRAAKPYGNKIPRGLPRGILLNYISGYLVQTVSTIMKRLIIALFLVQLST